MESYVLNIKLNIPPLKQDLIHQAIVEYHAGNKDMSLDSLGKALVLAEPEKHVRVFLDQGTDIIELLKEAVKRNISAYAVTLLKENEKEIKKTGSSLFTGNQDILPLLTKREQEVLKLLNTTLSYQEIADTMFVAESTVHSHIKSIYRKLNVHKRMEAVKKAKEIGLLI